MHILLTRPERQGQQTAELVRARGHRVTHAPMLRIEVNPDSDLGNRPYAALVMTSANAADAIARHLQRESILNTPTFVVGDRTAEAAREAGFTHVISADGDIARLVEIAAKKIPPGGSVLYLAGEDRAGDLAGSLEAAGHPVRTAVVYRAIAMAALPEETIRALQSDSIHAVLHYSRRSGETFLGLAAAGSCLVNVLKCKHFCLSAQVAQPLVGAGAKQVHVAQRPDESALLDLVDNT
jgi:uroporphyrinogen-III synthase